MVYIPGNSLSTKLSSKGYLRNKIPFGKYVVQVGTEVKLLGSDSLAKYWQFGDEVPLEYFSEDCKVEEHVEHLIKLLAIQIIMDSPDLNHSVDGVVEPRSTDWFFVKFFHISEA